jgi:hypothetical protein
MRIVENTILDRGLLKRSRNIATIDHNITFSIAGMIIMFAIIPVSEKVPKRNAEIGAVASVAENVDFRVSDAFGII